MALTPTPEQTRAEQLAAREAAQKDLLMREVDEAVRQDEAAQFARKYGKAIVGGIVLSLAAFGGWLWWQEHREGQFEQGSEQFIKGLDELQAGNNAGADSEFAAIAKDGTPAAAAGAAILRAGMLIEQGKHEEAATMLFAVADDGDAPQAYRDLAAIRAVATSFDTMDPQKVIDRLKPLATPGNAWFASAGELVAMAYLKQGKTELAGPLFASIAKDEDAPQTLRSRTRQMAGMLGYDAVVDIDKAVAEAGDAQASAQ